MIIIPSKSILNQPNLNICNDNIYEDINYQNNKYYMNKESILDFNIAYCEQTNQSKIIQKGDNSYHLYSGYNNNYKYYLDDLNNINPKIDNENVIYIKNNTLSQSEHHYDFHPNNNNFDYIFPDFNNYISIFKIKINKDNMKYNYKSINVSYIFNQNYLSRYTTSGEIIALDSSYCLQNSSIQNDDFNSNKELNIFHSENDIFEYIFIDYVNKENPILNQRLINNDVLSHTIILDENNDMYLYLFITSWVRRISEIYNIDNINLNINIKIYIDILENNIVDINKESKYSLPDNELLSEQTTILDKSIYNKIEEDIVSEYEYGKHSVELNCLYMQYKNDTGEIVYTGKDGNMIKVGDIIQPYYYDNELGDLPIATYPNGTPMNFKVYKSDISTNDGVMITNNINAIEITQQQEYTLTFDNDDVLEIKINGKTVTSPAITHYNDILEVYISDSEIVDKVYLNSNEIIVPYKGLVQGNISIYYTTYMNYTITFPSKYLDIMVDGESIISGDLVRGNKDITIKPKDKTMLFEYLKDENDINLLPSNNISDFSIKDLVDGNKSYSMKALAHNSAFTTTVAKQIPIDLVDDGSFYETINNFTTEYGNIIDITMPISTSVIVSNDKWGDDRTIATLVQHKTFNEMFNGDSMFIGQGDVIYGFISMSNQNGNLQITYQSYYQQITQYKEQYIVFDLPIYEIIVA